MYLYSLCLSVAAVVRVCVSLLSAVIYAHGHIVLPSGIILSKNWDFKSMQVGSSLV